MDIYLSSFIFNLERVFENINIYRTIIILNNYNYNNLNLLIKKLKENNHIPIFINSSHDINYNYRLFIMKDISLLSHINKNHYNFIAIY